MKTLAILILASLASTFTWAQKQAVGNSKVNTDFSKYKSFSWAQSDATIVGPEGYDIYYYEFEPADRTNKKINKTKRVLKEEAQQEKPAYIYSYSVIIPAKDVNANNVIKDAISNELEGRGYRETPDNGDLLVVYQVLEQHASLHGYNNDDPAVASGQQVRQPSDTATFALEPGTLMINLIDRKTSEVVWSGFSSDMINNNSFITDEVELKEAIHSVFDQFKYTADKARKN